jgi:hypothetical protein
MGWKADIIGSLRAFPLLTDGVEKGLAINGEQ